MSEREPSQRPRIVHDVVIEAVEIHVAAPRPASPRGADDRSLLPPTTRRPLRLRIEVL